MAKSVKLQVFLEPKIYLELINEAKGHGFNAKTDSGLINRVICYFINEVPSLTIDVHHKKQIIEKQAIIIEQLRNEIKELKGVKYGSKNNQTTTVKI